MKVYFLFQQKYFLLFLISFLFYSCLNVEEFNPDNIAEIKWNPKYAIPLAYGSLGIENALKEEDSANLKEYEDGLYYLSIEEEIRLQDVSELINIPNQSINRRYSQPAPLIIPANSDYPLHQESEILDLSISPEQLSDAGFSQGFLGLDLETNIIGEIEITVTFPTLTQNQESFQLNFTIYSNGFVQHSEQQSVRGYIADFSTLTPDYNRLPFETEVKYKTNNQPVEITTAEYISYTLTFNNLDLKYARGYFGRQSIDIPSETLEISLLPESLNTAELSLKDTKLDFNLINQYGIPVSVVFNQFEARKNDGSSLAVETNPASPINISHPLQPSEQTETLIKITNADQIFNNQPDELYYDAFVTINPSDVVVPNFTTDTSKLILQVRSEIPLYGSAKNILLKDTLEFTLSDDIKEAEVKNALVKIKATNKFPVNARLQIYFTDQYYHITDSLLQPNQANIIKSSSVDTDGNLIPGGEGVFDDVISIDNESFEHLLDTDYIILVADLSTTQNADGSYPNVKIKSGYTIELDLGIQTELDLTLNP